MDSPRTKLLSIQEVADWLGVHEDTVKNLAIPFTRVGRQRRYQSKSIDLYLQNHSPRPEAWAKGGA